MTNTKRPFIIQKTNNPKKQRELRKQLILMRSDLHREEIQEIVQDIKQHPTLLTKAFSLLTSQSLFTSLDYLQPFLKNFKNTYPFLTTTLSFLLASPFRHALFKKKGQVIKWASITFVTLKIFNFFKKNRSKSKHY